VTVLDADTGAERFQFQAYDARMRSGVHVAVGDINGDGSLDIITAPGPGAAPVMRVFSSTDGTLLGQFELPRSWAWGGVSVAAGDVNGDGKSDIIVGNLAGPAQVRVFEGFNGQLVENLTLTTASGRHAQRGGVEVAAGDLNGDGHADIVALSAHGRSNVQVLDGQGGAVLARYLAFARPARGETSVAVGKLGSDRRLGVIVAGAAPRSHDTVVKFFEGTSGTDAQRFVEPGTAGRRGVGIAAVNLGGRGNDELAILPKRGLGGGATILSRTPLMFNVSPSAPGSPSSAVAYRLPASLGAGFLAGDNSVAIMTPAAALGSIEPPLSQNLPVIQRLAYFDPNTHKFVPVQPNDPRLVGKDITVISHGWAPGYQGWVDYEATQKNHVLKWWETDPSQPGYDPSWTAMHKQGMDSDWLLYGETSSTIFGSTEVSATGLAQSILNRRDPKVPGSPTDPNAVVLAYSWIDDSATPDWNVYVTKIPEEAWKSEALTTLNGERLASALEQVLGTNFTGKLQLVGHSHGSKVVSVAAAALQQARMPVNEVTLLDSPEDDVTVVGDAANYNWYFLKDLTTLNRGNPAGTFVSNTISEFDVPYSGITLSNGQGTNLSQVVDVNLTPDIYYSWDLSDRHGYAANWYSGSADPNLTYGQKVGQYWSPLLPANSGSNNPVKNLSPYYEQNWGYLSQPANQQFVLNPKSAAPTETIQFTSLSTPSVSLTQDGTMIQSLPVSMRAPLRGQSGLAFNYQFPTSQPGDRLVVLDGSDVAFVMDAALVGTAPQHATISLSALPLESHALTFVLLSETSNTTSQVVVSNFQSFEQPVL
jgi:hypothetical protein